MATQKKAVAARSAKATGPAVSVKSPARKAAATKKPVAKSAQPTGAKVTASLAVKSPTQKARAAAAKVATRDKK